MPAGAPCPQIFREGYPGAVKKIRKREFFLSPLGLFQKSTGKSGKTNTPSVGDAYSLRQPVLQIVC
jgi:hypothetical protein